MSIKISNNISNNAKETERKKIVIVEYGQVSASSSKDLDDLEKLFPQVGNISINAAHSEIFKTIVTNLLRGSYFSNNALEYDLMYYAAIESLKPVTENSHEEITKLFDKVLNSFQTIRLYLPCIYKASKFIRGVCRDLNFTNDITLNDIIVRRSYPTSDNNSVMWKVSYFLEVVSNNCEAIPSKPRDNHAWRVTSIDDMLDDLEALGLTDIWKKWIEAND